MTEADVTTAILGFFVARCLGAEVTPLSAGIGRKILWDVTTVIELLAAISNCT